MLDRFVITIIGPVLFRFHFHFVRSFGRWWWCWWCHSLKNGTLKNCFVVVVVRSPIVNCILYNHKTIPFNVYTFGVRLWFIGDHKSCLLVLLDFYTHKHTSFPVIRSSINHQTKSKQKIPDNYMFSSVSVHRSSVKFGIDHSMLLMMMMVVALLPIRLPNSTLGCCCCCCCCCRN